MAISRKLKIFLLLSVLLVVISLIIVLNSSNLTGFSVFGSNELTPGDFIKDDSLVIGEDSLTITLGEFILSRYNDSQSMVPVFGEDSTGIEIVPNDENQINIGDIITFEEDGMLIAHRVVEKGYDEEGVFFITKGDGNNINDGKIRFSQVRGILVGILY